MNPEESTDHRPSYRGGRGRGGSNSNFNNRGSNRGYHTSSNTSSQSNVPNTSSSHGDDHSGNRGSSNDGNGRNRGRGRNRFMSPAKAERARLARETINTTIPHILQHTPRAKAGVESAQKYAYSEIPTVTKTGGNPYIPKISVVYNDTFDAARDLVGRLKSQFPRDYEAGRVRVGVLNMASNTNPGGGVLNGSQAQEETLCRRSTLYPSLLKRHFHPLPAGAAVFTSDVLVFMTQGYEMLKVEDRFYVDVISMAAPKRPELTGDKKRYADQASYEELIFGVKGMMRVAQEKGVTHFVAGAFGCGAYGNPNALVAECFKRVICGRRFGSEGWEREEREVWSGVREVVFAIYGEDRGKGNLAAFKEAFGDVMRWQEGQVGDAASADVDIDGEGESAGGSTAQVNLAYSTNTNLNSSIIDAAWAMKSPWEISLGMKEKS
ncbi:hypothetical protein TWF970_007400 [Orbilia oligospora]|uniref:Microbial-type PARG catalytic domain-containing protein n=1 Tax=Orbilia oligospora TaxID=2813651 RepID=A0A7C8VN25_ORBOL|nr:hypothetical protein TWF970_007400 [Orbilia oligospora]